LIFHDEVFTILDHSIERKSTGAICASTKIDVGACWAIWLNFGSSLNSDMEWRKTFPRFAPALFGNSWQWITKENIFTLGLTTYKWSISVNSVVLHRILETIVFLTEM